MMEKNPRRQLGKLKHNLVDCVGSLRRVGLCAFFLALPGAGIYLQGGSGEPFQDLLIPYQVILKIVGIDVKSSSELNYVMVGVGAIFTAILLRYVFAAVKACGHVAINFSSMCLSVIAAFAMGWADDEGQIPFAVQWFLIAAPERDAADLTVDLEECYATWVLHRGPRKASWLCYSRLFSYYGHRLWTQVLSPQRKSAR